jgi:hypothetical protein
VGGKKIPGPPTNMRPTNLIVHECLGVAPGIPIRDNRGDAFCCTNDLTVDPAQDPGCRRVCPSLVRRLTQETYPTPPGFKS